MLDEATRQRIMLQQEGVVLSSVGAYGDAAIACQIARCQLDGISNALIRMQGAKETSSFVFALSDRVAGGVRDVTDHWSPSVKVIEHEAPPAPAKSHWARLPDFVWGFLCGLAAMVVVTSLAMGRV